MKSVFLCCALLIPLSAVAKAENRPAAPVAATQAAPAPAERQLAILEPAGLAAPPVDSRHAAAVPATPPPSPDQPGWREQLALLGAALLALLFILRRQLTHRMGERPPQSPPAQPRWDPGDPSAPASTTGFMLSHFDNLPAETEPAAAHAPRLEPVHRKARPPARKPRTRTRWPARNRPPDV